MLNVVLAAQMVRLRESAPGTHTLRVRKQILKFSRFIIGIVLQQHRMQERLARNQPTSLWAPAPEPRAKGRDQRRAAEDS